MRGMWAQVGSAEGNSLTVQTHGLADGVEKSQTRALSPLDLSELPEKVPFSTHCLFTRTRSQLWKSPIAGALTGKKIKQSEAIM